MLICSIQNHRADRNTENAATILCTTSNLMRLYHYSFIQCSSQVIPIHSLAHHIALMHQYVPVFGCQMTASNHIVPLGMRIQIKIVNRNWFHFLAH